MVFFSFVEVSVAAEARPNVVVVMTDDQGYTDLACHGHPVLKTPHLDRLYTESIRLSEDRERFAEVLAGLDIPQPEHGIARSLEEARTIAEGIGYPVLVRPSFVLGGRAMAIVGEAGGLEGFVQAALEATPGSAVAGGSVFGGCV